MTRTNEGEGAVRYLWTIIGAVIAGLLLLSLALNLADPDFYVNELVIVAYLGIVAGILAGGVKLDRRRERTQR